MTVVGDDDQSIYSSAARRSSQSSGSGTGNRTPERSSSAATTARWPRSRLSYRLVPINDPDRLEVLAGSRSGCGRSVRPRRRPTRCASRRSRPTPRKRTGSRAESVVGSPRTRGLRDLAVLLGPTATRTRFCAVSTSAGIPWRFSGNVGLYARPEVAPASSRFLRAIADLLIERRRHALSRRGAYGLVRRGSDGDRQHRSPAPSQRWEVLESSSSSLNPSTLGRPHATVVSRFVATMRRFTRLAHVSPAGEVLYRSCAIRGRWRGSRQRIPSRQRSPFDIARFFDIVRAQSALLSDDRAIFVARHTPDAHRGGDDPPPPISTPRPTLSRS